MSPSEKTERRDATEGEMDALRAEVASERKRTRIVLGAVLVFVIMGIGILWNSIADEVTRLAVIGALVAAEMAGLVFLSVRRSARERLVRADWEAGEVEVREGRGSSGRSVRFSRSGIDVTGSGR